jgi:hypothetical protein
MYINNQPEILNFALIMRMIISLPLLLAIKIEDYVKSINIPTGISWSDSDCEVGSDEDPCVPFPF